MKLALWKQRLMNRKERTDLKSTPFGPCAPSAFPAVNPPLPHTLSLLTAALLLTACTGLAEQIKPFPEHWGAPPDIQTMDYIEWPGGFGHGSSTVAHWIREHMAQDTANAGPAATTVYTARFEETTPGDVPDDFMVLNGDFAVRDHAGHKVLELPGTPIESFAVLFGPAGSENVRLSARIRSTSKGRRHPSFAVGLNGLSGFRVKVVPAARRLELWHGADEGGEIVDSVAFQWTSGEWMTINLQARKTAPSEWAIEGKAWMEPDPEPTGYTLSHVEQRKPLAGRPVLSANPYAGTPIQFDDLTVSTLQP